QLSPSETVAYVSLCWQVDRKQSLSFTDEDHSGLDPRTRVIAMDGLEFRGLIIIGNEITLCDPYTGLEIPPIDDEIENLQNQRTTINGVTHPTVFNFEKTPEFMEKLGSALGIEFKKSGENYKTLCLYHTDTQ